MTLALNMEHLTPRATATEHHVILCRRISFSFSWKLFLNRNQIKVQLTVVIFCEAGFEAEAGVTILHFSS